MSDATPGISVIIPNLNGGHYLGPCLTSVFAQGLAADELEVILIDNASTDDSVDVVRNDFPTVRIMTNSRNIGFTQAVNQGLDVATRDVILLLNNDTVMQPGALVRLRAELLQHEDLAGVQPLLLWAGDSNVVDSAGIALSKPFAARDDLNGYTVALAPTEPVETWGVCFACALIRKSVFEECGKLDPDFFAEWDDVDWCLRARWMGYRFMLEPSARVLHHRSPTLKKMPDERYVRLRRNQLCTFVKAFPPWMAFRRVGYRFQRDLFMLPHHLRKGTIRPVLDFWNAAFGLWPQMLNRRRKLLGKARLTSGQMARQLRQFVRAGHAAWQQHKSQMGTAVLTPERLA